MPMAMPPSSPYSGTLNLHSGPAVGRRRRRRGDAGGVHRRPATHLDGPGRASRPPGGAIRAGGTGVGDPAASRSRRRSSPGSRRRSAGQTGGCLALGGVSGCEARGRATSTDRGGHTRSPPVHHPVRSTCRAAASCRRRGRVAGRSALAAPGTDACRRRRVSGLDVRLRPTSAACAEVQARSIGAPGAHASDRWTATIDRYRPARRRRACCRAPRTALTCRDPMTAPSQPSAASRRPPAHGGEHRRPRDRHRRARHRPVSSSGVVMPWAAPWASKSAVAAGAANKCSRDRGPSLAVEHVVRRASAPSPGPAVR